VHAVQSAEAHLDGCQSADVSLAQVNRIDGSGAVLLARLLDRLAVNGCRTDVAGGDNPEASRILALYRRHRTANPSLPSRTMNPLTRLGAMAAQIPAKANTVFDFTGRCAAALPKTVAAPTSVDWRSLPRLMQEIGADALPVTSVANLLVGIQKPLRRSGQAARPRGCELQAECGTTIAYPLQGEIDRTAPMPATEMTTNKGSNQSSSPADRNRRREHTSAR